MNTDPKSEGVVIYHGTNNRVVHAAILLTPKDPASGTSSEPVPYQTNEDGVFINNEPDKPWNIEILHKDIIPYTNEWKPDDKRKIFWVYEDEKSKLPGIVFFGCLIVALTILLVLYNHWHHNLDVAGGPLSNVLVQKVEEAQHQFRDIRNAETDFVKQIGLPVKETGFTPDTAAALIRSVYHGKIDSVNAFLKLRKTPKDPLIKGRLDKMFMAGANLEQMQKQQREQMIGIDTFVVHLLRIDNNLMKVDKDKLQSLTPGIQKAMAENDTLEVKKQTAELLQRVTTPPWPGFVPWRQEPWRFFEILLWALAGVLVQKIITSGVYLWKNTFQNRGIWMHVAHIFVVPLLVLVTMMLLSMVSFEFSATNGGNGVVIDIADPSISRAFSFILAVAPWGVWDFVRAQAARITARREEG